MRPLIAGNWKMHGLTPQLVEIETVAASVHAISPAADVLICVPATLLSRAAQIAAGRIAIGGEDCDAEVSGRYTGRHQRRYADGCGGDIGHRWAFRAAPAYHQETDAMVAAKASGGVAVRTLHHHLHW